MEIIIVPTADGLRPVGTLEYAMIVLGCRGRNTIVRRADYYDALSMQGVAPHAIEIGHGLRGAVLESLSAPMYTTLTL